METYRFTETYHAIRGEVKLRKTSFLKLHLRKSHMLEYVAWFEQENTDRVGVVWVTLKGYFFEIYPNIDTLMNALRSLTPRKTPTYGWERRHIGFFQSAYHYFFEYLARNPR